MVITRAVKVPLPLPRKLLEYFKAKETQQKTCSCHMTRLRFFVKR
jgi:hypothetical protein